MTKRYSKCVECSISDTCKAYDKTDLTLDDCNDFLIPLKTIIKYLHNGIVALSNNKLITYHEFNFIIKLFDNNKIGLKISLN